jgi:hypothetical protein
MRADKVIHTCRGLSIAKRACPLSSPRKVLNPTRQPFCTTQSPFSALSLAFPELWADCAASTYNTNVSRLFIVLCLIPHALLVLLLKDPLHLKGFFGEILYAWWRIPIPRSLSRPVPCSYKWPSMYMPTRSPFQRQRRSSDNRVGDARTESFPSCLITVILKQKQTRNGRT